MVVVFLRGVSIKNILVLQNNKMDPLFLCVLYYHTLKVTFTVLIQWQH